MDDVRRDRVVQLQGVLCCLSLAARWCRLGGRLGAADDCLVVGVGIGAKGGEN